MPAHKTLANCQLFTKSNGARMSPFDWKVNRLVDKGAKWAAEGGRLSPFMRKAFKFGLIAQEFALVRLGFTTVAANNHVVWTEPPDGSARVKTVYRDTVADTANKAARKRAVKSKAEVRAKKRARAKATPPCAALPSGTTMGNVHVHAKLGSRHAKSAGKARAVAEHRRRLQAAKAKTVQRWRGSLAKRLHPARAVAPDWRTSMLARIRQRQVLNTWLKQRYAEGKLG